MGKGFQYSVVWCSVLSIQSYGAVFSVFSRMFSVLSVFSRMVKCFQYSVIYLVRAVFFSNINQEEIQKLNQEIHNTVL